MDHRGVLDHKALSPLASQATHGKSGKTTSDREEYSQPQHRLGILCQKDDEDSSNSCHQTQLCLRPVVNP